MNSCDEFNASILPFLDNELSAEDREFFSEHLATCSGCQQKLEEEEKLSRFLHRVRPLHIAPESLRARVAAATTIAKVSVQRSQVSEKPRKSVYRMLPQSLHSAVVATPQWTAWTAAVLLIAIGLTFVPNMVQQAQAMSYVDAAVATHRSYLEGNLPLEVQSGSPDEVSEWFEGKVPFHFRLPASQLASSGKPNYQLAGARLVNYKGSYAALVTYRMQEERISLLVTSSKKVVAAGGDEVRSGQLLFHYCKRDGFNIVTWSNHGLTYALVSSLHDPAQNPCLVCHQDMKDKSNFGAR